MKWMGTEFSNTSMRYDVYNSLPPGIRHWTEALQTPEGPMSEPLLALPGPVKSEKVLD
jgi:hypothetical protein